jgi:hypothetical protein
MPRPRSCRGPSAPKCDPAPTPRADGARCPTRCSASSRCTSSADRIRRRSARRSWPSSRPWLLAVNEPRRLLADLDFAAGRPARLELDAGAHHPALGSGLQVRLAIPVEPDAAIAQRLNADEAAQPDAHQLGAWCVDPDRGLAFVSFVPSAVCMPELPRALVYHAAGRNEWARELLFPQ